MLKYALSSLFVLATMATSTLSAEDSSIEAVSQKSRVERTLSIIKPDATERNNIGKIIDKFETSGLKVVGAKMIHLTREQAQGFYAVHKERPFYGSLVDFMTSGPVIVMVLEGQDAVRANRTLMGATNPQEAAPGTIRSQFARSITENSVHGSDCPENAKIEIDFFFSDAELHSKA